MASWVYSGMNESLTPIQKLDNILNLIVDSQDSLSGEKIMRLLNLEWNKQELEEILEQIEEDGFIKNTIKSPLFELSQYRSTFKGRLFRVSIGYPQQESDRKENDLRIRLENSRNRLNQILLVIGAIGAALGAIGLIAWEMYKYFCLEKH